MVAENLIPEYIPFLGNLFLNSEFKDFQKLVELH